LLNGRLEADFSELPLGSKYSSLAKFMMNPEDNWGPKARAQANKRYTDHHCTDPDT
jgi:hypothetical protein